MPETKKRGKTRGLFMSWFFSYTIIIIQCVLLSAIVYAHSLKTVEDGLKKTNEAMLQQVRLTMDSYLKDVTELMLSMSLNTPFNFFASKEKPFDTHDSFTMLEMYKDLKAYKISNGLVKSLYLYYPNSDTCITEDGIFTARQLYKSEYAESGVGYDTFAEMLTEYANNDFHIVEFNPFSGAEGAAAQKRVFFRQTLPLNGTAPRIGNMLMLLDEEKLKSVIRKVNNEYIDGVAVTDSRGYVIFGTGSGESLEHYAAGGSGEKGTSFVELEKRTLYATHIQSNINGWQYVMLVSPDLYTEKLHSVRGYMALALVACLILGGVLSYYFSYKNYYPVKQTLKLLSDKTGAVSSELPYKEYKIISHSIHTAMAEKERLQERLAKQNNLLRENLIYKLLRGYGDSAVPSEEAMQYFEIRFSTAFFLVAVYKISHYGIFSVNLEEERLIKFVVARASDEILQEENESYTIEIDNMIVSLICLREGKPEQGYEAVKKSLERVRELLKDHFELKVEAVLSTVHQEKTGIAEAFYEALEIMEYRAVSGVDAVVCREDIPGPYNGYRAYVYSIEQEQRLINHIKADNMESAQKELLGIIHSNMNMPLPLLRLMIMDLISTMIKAINELELYYGEEFIKNLDPVETLLKCHNIIEMKTVMLNYLESFHHFISQKKKSHNKDLKNKLVAFIAQNFTDSNLNIETTAGHFNMNPIYISRFFKEQMGESMLDYINRKKIEKAKGLLADERLGVGDIAGMCGFSSHTTFIRAFKKAEGLTPTQYREIVG